MGLLHIYNSLDDTHKTINANGKIKNIFPEYKDFLFIKSGCKVDSEYFVEKNDVIFCRLVPAGLETLAVIGIVTGVIALGVGIGSAISSKNKSAAIQEEYEKQQQMADELAAGVTTLPFLSGASNQSALGKTIPYVMGDLKFAPYAINKGFYSIGGTDGKDQFFNLLLCAGYNNQKLKSLYIGNKKVLSFDQTEIDQNKNYSIVDDFYGNIELQVCDNGELYSDKFNQKIVGEVYGDEIKHDYEQSAEPLIKQLPQNAQRVEVCVQFNGLRQYGDNGWEEREVTIHPYWCNNMDDDTPVWHPFHFKVKASTYQWVDLDSEGIEDAIEDGLLKTGSQTIQMPGGQQVTHTTYISNSSDITVKCNNLILDDWTIKRRYVVSTENDRFVKNTNETIRFVAEYDFTAEETYGKNIAVKLVRETPKLNGNAQEVAILQYINTYCYDATTSSDEALEPCRLVVNPFRDQTLRLGLRIKANENTKDVIDELSIETCGIAKVFSGTSLTSTKQPTRNPIALIIELLTSEFHQASMYSLDELKLSTFSSAYNYCAQNNFYCDYLITSGIKKSELISKILSTIGASLIIGPEGLLEIAIDRKEDYPVALLNNQTIKSFKFGKSFERKITGQKVTYTDRNTWKIATEYFMQDGSTTYDPLTDRLGELALDTVTTHEHAYKVSQRQQRELVLQPNTFYIDVGLEGELYPLYSKILVQINALKQGLANSIIRKVNIDDDFITSIEIGDTVTFAEGYEFGVIIQAQNDNGKRLIYAEVIGNGKTKLLTFDTPISLETVNPEVGNELSFGLLDENGAFTKITKEMKIYDISPSNNGGFTLTCKDYNDALYETGDIPAYKSNLTTRPKTERTLDTVSQADLDAAIIEANAFTREIGNGLSARIDGIVVTTTVCSADKNSEIYSIDGEGKTVVSSTTEINISLKQGEVNLPFVIGNIQNLPDGFSYVVEGNTLKLTIGQGILLRTGTIMIPVVYRPIVRTNPYVDETDEAYCDESGVDYYEVEYANSDTQWQIPFTWFASGTPVYLGMVSSLNAIPADANIGDYIVWSGANHTTSTLSMDGEFLQAATYKFVGNGQSWSWERDRDAGHAQIVLSDVLGIANADLEHNNSKVWEYLDHLTSNSIYTDMIVANQAFIAQIAAQVVTAELVTTTELEAVKATIEGEISAASATIENKITVGTIIAKEAETAGSAGYASSAGSAADTAKVQGYTIIEGGYIKTSLLDVGTILGSDAYFSGTLVGARGSFSGSVTASSFYTSNGIKSGSVAWKYLNRTTSYSSLLSFCQSSAFGGSYWHAAGSIVFSYQGQTHRISFCKIAISADSNNLSISGTDFEGNVFNIIGNGSRLTSVSDGISSEEMRDPTFVEAIIRCL